MSNAKISKLILPFILVTLLVGAVGFALYSPETGTEVEQTISDSYYSFTGERFQSSLGNSPAMIVNFYADWCASCSEMEPAIVDVLSELGPKQSVVGFKVNYGDASETSANRDFAKSYGVTMQSTVLVLNSEGKVFKSFFSSVSRDELRQAVLAASLA